MRMKILIRKNLKMTPGKIAAQAVHAALGTGSMDPMTTVVVLQVSDKKFKEATVGSYAQSHAYIQRDLGLTEVPVGTETAIAWLEDDND